MSESRIAGRYAKSLIELSQELNQLDNIRRDMDTILNGIKASHQLSVFLHSPVVRFDKKLKVLNEVFKDLSPLTLKFIENIVRKSREANLKLIAEEFNRQYNSLKGIGTATVTTAVPLSDSASRKVAAVIKDLTKLESVEIISEVDPDIIGGLVIRFGDRLIDASIRENLNQIKKALV